MICDELFTLFFIFVLTYTVSIIPTYILVAAFDVTTFLIFYYQYRYINFLLLILIFNKTCIIFVSFLNVHIFHICIIFWNLWPIKNSCNATTATNLKVIIIKHIILLLLKFYFIYIGLNLFDLFLIHFLICVLGYTFSIVFCSIQK